MECLGPVDLVGAIEPAGAIVRRIVAEAEALLSGASFAKASVLQIKDDQHGVFGPS